MTVIKTKKRSWVTTIIIVLAFALPIAAGYYLYLHPDILKKRTNNKGHLIQQPLDFYKLPLKPDGDFTLNQLKGKWLMLYVNPKQCGKLCEKNLFYMRQIKTALPKEATRLARVILTFNNQADPELEQALQNDFPGTFHVNVNRQVFSEFILSLPSRKLALTSGTLYLVDPHGNIMMSYAPDVNPDDIFKDLTKLLKFSRIG